jgi:hypothetical protein
MCRDHRQRLRLFTLKHAASMPNPVFYERQRRRMLRAVAGPGQGGGRSGPVAVVGGDHHHPRDLAVRGDERPHPGDPAPDRIDAWLHPQLTDKTAAQKLISGIEYAPLQVRPVSTVVNKTGRAGSKGPELIDPLADHTDEPLQQAAGQDQVTIECFVVGAEKPRNVPRQTATPA